MSQIPIMSDCVVRQLNELGYHGPHGNQPEVTNFFESGSMACLKKEGSFSIQAEICEECGRTYTLFSLTHYPRQNLNPREGLLGPVARIQIVNILEEDLSSLPIYEARLRKAGEAFE